MFAKLMLVAMCVAGAQAGLLPFAAAPAPLAHAAVVAPYASSFNAHRINHAVAFPVAPPVAPVAFAAPPRVTFAAPAFAPAPAIAAPAPAFAAPAPAFAAPAPAFAAPALAPAPLAPAPAFAPAPLAAPLHAHHLAAPLGFSHPLGLATPARFGLPAPAAHFAAPVPAPLAVAPKFAPAPYFF